MRYETEKPTSNAFGVLRLPRTVLFGDGQRAAAGALVAQWGRSTLICTDARLSESPELAELVATLEAAGVSVVVYGRTEAELPIAGIRECVAEVRSRTIDSVVGFGGGSCLDMAKVVALLLAHGGEPSDYYGENLVPGPTLPVLAIPTTAGTGSEVTPVAVIADPERAMKVGISSPHLVPQAAICDPELTHSCPATLTAASGIDAVVHLVESFTAVRRDPTPALALERVFVGSAVFSDAAALQGLSLLGRSLVAAHRAPGDRDARRDVMLGAFFGGVALGTGGTGAAHALQYPIGAATHTPHGYGVGALLPYVTRFNLPTRRRQFAEIGAALGAVHGSDEWASAVAGIVALDDLVDALGIPTLRELGVSEDQLPDLARQGLLATRLVENNPRPLEYADMLAILSAAFHGDRSMPSKEPLA